MGEVPRTLFHGTPTVNVESIREKGLLRGTTERANFEEFRHDIEGCVFLSEKQKDARFFGLAATMERGRVGDFTVLFIDSMKAAIHGIPILEPEGRLDPRAFEGRQFVACGDIPPDAIVGGLRVYKDPETGKIKEERLSF